MSSYSLLRYLSTLLAAVTCLLSPLRADAFAPETYAAESRLAQGNWVKVKTSRSGIHCITPSQLRQWGFSRPERVRVYGYGARPTGDILSLNNYIDDLPMTLCEYTAQGLVFYSTGAKTHTVTQQKYWKTAPNYYSEETFYLLTEATDEELSAETPTIGEPSATTGTSFFQEIIVHEKELVSPGQTGHRFIGEDFRYTRKQTFTFNLPERDKSEKDIWVNCAFAYKAINGKSTITMSVNGKEIQLPPESILDATTDNNNLHYSLVNIPVTVENTDDRVSLDVTFATNANPLRLARLDNITLNYPRKLSLGSAPLEFRLWNTGKATLEGATAQTRVWDVTDAADIRRVVTSEPNTQGQISWNTRRDNSKAEYVAWTPGSSMPSVELAATVPNQNLHGRETPDMVIITLPQWRQYAESLANLHRTDPQNLDVLVVTDNECFNEFSGGTPDINAVRRMLKMFWDRGGGTSDGKDSKLRYALMFGRAMYDHRGITPEARQIKNNILLQWQSQESGSSSTSFTTEDYLAFLLDGSGAKFGTDRLCIAVGRIPVSSESEAAVSVEKIRRYMADEHRSEWKNRIVMATDDGNYGDHIDQMEKVYTEFMSTTGGLQNVYHKVYVDAFPLINGQTPDAHDRMWRLLNQGAIWWWYIGHASTTSWTAEGLLTIDDIHNARFTNPPMLFAATCNFLRWDTPDESGAETLFFNENGIIGAIAATRPVYIGLNERMCKALASAISATVGAGRRVPIGELLQNAKNTLISSSGDDNKLRYVLLGDPAMPLSNTTYRAIIETIGDKEVSADDKPVIMAHQNVDVRGRIVDGDGNTATGFNGTMTATVFDAEYSTTSLAHYNDGKNITFQEMGEKLFVGRSKVENGEFTITLDMPSEIASNYRPATMNIYADSDNGADASGVTRDFYVYGYDDSDNSDIEAPVIELFALNSESFRSGDKVNATPMVIAGVSDNVGINMSSAGIGHQISLQLDGSKTFTDVTESYVPGTDGAKSGKLYYQLPELTQGRHTLRLRIWDTSNNMGESTIEFVVEPNQAPKIIDLYTDANPAIDHANFYVRHNRPDAVIKVDLGIYDLMGRMVWGSSRSGRSDLFESAPIQWDLSDRAGRRVGRGIYVYRATVTPADGSPSATATRKIAVAGN
ncbi:type IX secretion system sortase PorU [uncultured Muribaculum sp.]|uniref:type IX secretion system sortase PorU n=1 Tax=uncultured Muribaculum sp. TaxID=1918613 RepID=UPI0025B0C0F7|nr:type IX secretion system sortase PorU [uncultured Muribaculum sp.]